MDNNNSQTVIDDLLADLQSVKSSNPGIDYLVEKLNNFDYSLFVNESLEIRKISLLSVFYLLDCVLKEIVKAEQKGKSSKKLSSERRGKIKIRSPLFLTEKLVFLLLETTEGNTALKVATAAGTFLKKEGEDGQDYMFKWTDLRPVSKTICMSGLSRPLASKIINSAQDLEHIPDPRSCLAYISISTYTGLPMSNLHSSFEIRYTPLYKILNPISPDLPKQAAELERTIVRKNEISIKLIVPFGSKNSDQSHRSISPMLQSHRTPFSSSSSQTRFHVISKYTQKPVKFDLSSHCAKTTITNVGLYREFEPESMNLLPLYSNLLTPDIKPCPTVFRRIASFDDSSPSSRKNKDTKKSPITNINFTTASSIQMKGCFVQLHRLKAKKSTESANDKNTDTPFLNEEEHKFQLSSTGDTVKPSILIVKRNTPQKELSRESSINGVRIRRSRTPVRRQLVFFDKIVPKAPLLQ